MYQFRRPELTSELTLQQKEQRIGMWNVYMYMYFHPMTR
jgi:hypothetical protein